MKASVLPATATVHWEKCQILYFIILISSARVGLMKASVLPATAIVHWEKCQILYFIILISSARFQNTRQSRGGEQTA